MLLNFKDLRPLTVQHLRRICPIVSGIGSGVRKFPGSAIPQLDARLAKGDEAVLVRTMAVEPDSKNETNLEYELESRISVTAGSGSAEYIFHALREYFKQQNMPHSGFAVTPGVFATFRDLPKPGRKRGTRYRLKRNAEKQLELNIKEALLNVNGNETYHVDTGFNVELASERTVKDADEIKRIMAAHTVQADFDSKKFLNCTHRIKTTYEIVLANDLKLCVSEVENIVEGASTRQTEVEVERLASDKAMVTSKVARDLLWTTRAIVAKLGTIPAQVRK